MRKLSSALLFAALVGLAGLTSRPAATAAGQDDGKWVTIKGQIVYAGAQAPQQQPLNVTKDQQACLAKGPILNEELVVNKSNNGIENVFVWITSESGGKPQINPALAKP